MHFSLHLAKKDISLTFYNHKKPNAFANTILGQGVVRIYGN